MNYIVTVFVITCVAIAWHRSAARAGSTAWRRRVAAMGWGILALPLAIAGFGLFGTDPWTIAIMALSGIAVILAPAIAADLVPVMLVLLGGYGMVIAAAVFNNRVPPGTGPNVLYGAVLGASYGSWRNMLIVPEAVVFLVFGLWLIPRTIGADIRTVTGLTRRVQRLAQTRSDAVDSAAAELRRVERDLHDGAQARLVALGMSLRAAERMIPTKPDAALALVAEAREMSSRALDDLRDLVRGIYPPVLADRGLGDAVRALVLDTPLPAELDIDLAGRPDPPVESAVYFAVAEVVANAVKHAQAAAIEVRMQHSGGVLRIGVTDDGSGGADPAKGTGLRSVQRRLGAFDGSLVVSSPPGGPTTVTIEVPCALSLLKTSSC